MRKVDKKQRRLNWPAVEQAIRWTLSSYVTGKNKAITRKYYVDGIEPVYPSMRRSQPDLLIRLLCEPEATEEQWAVWRKEYSTRDDFASVLLLQKDGIGKFYFGNNSLFNGREAEIQALWYEDQLDQLFALKLLSYRDGLEKRREDRDILNVLSLFKNLINSNCKIKRNPYSFYSTSFNYELDFKVKCMEVEKDLPVNFDENEHCITLTHFFCPLECVYRHPERFNPQIQSRIKRLHNYFTNKETHAVLQHAYRRTIERQFEKYIEYSGAGASISVCIRYDHQDQLQAMLPLLYEETRYPCHADDPDGLINVLPDAGGDRGSRQSFKTVLNLWQAGFNAERHAVIDDVTLFLEFTVPLSWGLAQRVLYSLCADATNLQEKLKARKMLAGDNSHEATDSSEMVYLLKPIAGGWRAGAWNRNLSAGLTGENPEIVLKTELEEGDNPDIDSIVNEDGSIETTLKRLLDEGYSIIRQKGYPEKTGNMT